MFPTDSLVRIINDEREREIRETIRIRSLTRARREADRPHLLRRADRIRR
jgi:hypothetical protein